MGKQSRAPKPGNVSNGKVTPVQVAFMVDRYLSDNNYTKTLSVFRTEASNLFSRKKGAQVPKGLLSLGEILDEYICLKEQKLMVDNEKCRVERLLRGMQDAMNAYNSAGSISSSGAAVTTPIPLTGPRDGSHEDRLVYNCPSANAMPMLPSNTSDITNFSTPTANLPYKNKRKALRPASTVSPAVKKSCVVLPMNVPANSGTTTTYQAVHESHIQSSSHNNHQNGNSVQGSSVARNLFEQPPKLKTVSPCPKTPPRPLPSPVPSQVDKSISPSESSTVCYSSSTRHTPETIPTNCHVISSKTVILSPYKHIRISSPMRSTPSRSTKRDQVKGRLDFNDSDKPMSPEKMVVEEISSPVMDNGTVDIFSTDISDFDFFGTDICLSDLLVDIDLHGEGMGLPLQQALEPSFGFGSGPDNELGCEGIDTNGASCEPASGVTSYPSENDTSRQGLESLISVKSITKCIQIVSPVKNHVSSSGQVN